MGGWKIMPGSCSSGFRSRPSSGGWARRSKGLEVSKTNRMKPRLSRPITDRMRASTGSGRWRLNCATARVHPACISNHSNIEPSWLPQDAAMRKCKGSALLELVATLSTEKSLRTNEVIRQMKLITTSANKALALGRATAIQSARPFWAPTSGTVPSTRLTPSASHRAKCPSSGVMGSPS